MVYKSEQIAKTFFKNNYFLDYTDGEFPQENHLYFHIRKREVY